MHTTRLCPPCTPLSHPITPSPNKSTFATRTQEQQRQRWLGTREGARRNQRRPAAALGLDSDDMLPRFHILPRKHESAIRTRRKSEPAGKTGEPSMCGQCEAHLELSSAHVHDACARLWRDVERARESLRVCISVGLLTASEEIVKEPRAKLASGGREGRCTGVRSAPPFRPWVPEGGICAHVDQKAPPGYRTSGSAINNHTL